MANKSLFGMIITIALALIMLVTPGMVEVNGAGQVLRTTTVEVERQTVDYQSILDEFEDGELETKGTLTTFTGYKTINVDEIGGYDYVNETNIDDLTGCKVYYKFSYDKETNIVTISAELEDEFGEIYIDTITGAAFINEYGEIDAVMNVDGEGILLSEMRNAELIANCGWFRNLIKRVAKVVVVAATVAVVVAAATAVVVATAGAAAPAVVAAGVGVASTGVTAAAVAGTAIAAGATAAAITAGVGTAVAVGITIAEEVDGSMTINNVYKIGQEKRDDNTIELVRRIAKTATIESLRNMSKAYHIAFVVCQQFSENGTTYNVGDLYINKQALTFAEAYWVLCSSGLINSINELTSNFNIISAVNNIFIPSSSLSELANTIRGYQNTYFRGNTFGIYADSAEAAATLAVVTGAQIRSKDTELYGYGGAGGYNHFHDINHKIHIWYGAKKPW